MFTPHSRRKGWGGWSPISSEIAPSPSPSSLQVLATSGEPRGGNENTPLKTLIEQWALERRASGERGIVAGTSISVDEQSEPNWTWRRFMDAGTFDLASVEKKDRTVLLNHISSLESELYEYQYNMGLLLMERKEWSLKTEKLKVAAEDKEETLKKDLAACRTAKTQAEQWEENLKKALAVEKQCVIDLEKALKDMRAESADLKVSTDSTLAQARDMIAGTEERALVVNSKLHAAEALQAEATRKHGVAERTLQEADAREDAMRRERLTFKAEQAAYQASLNQERQTRIEMEQKLQEGQERLLEGQKLLYQREEFANQRDEALKKEAADLAETRECTEREQALLRQLEADMNARMSGISIREENAIKREIDVVKKEQELIIFQEKIAGRERVLEHKSDQLRETELKLRKEKEQIEEFEKALKMKEEALPEHQKGLIELQHKLDHQKAELEVQKQGHGRLVENFEKLQKSLASERNDIDKQKAMLLQKENDLTAKMDELAETEEKLDKRAMLQKEREKDAELKVKAIKEKERFSKAMEKEVEKKRLKHEAERENAKLILEEINQAKMAAEAEKQLILEENERLRITETEREELLKLQKCLKEEIDDCRTRSRAVVIKAEELKKEKERFEKEWDLLDEKKEEVRKETERAGEEVQRVSKWLRDEEARLKEEKKVLKEQLERGVEVLRLEKETFVSSIERERAEWFTLMEKEREDLKRSIELRRRDLEGNLLKRKEETEKELKEKESRLKKEIEREINKLQKLQDTLDKGLKNVNEERVKLEKERLQVLQLREEASREWGEIQRDVEELKAQREKLKEQREALIKEREATIKEGDKVRKLKKDFEAGTDDSALLQETMGIKGYSPASTFTSKITPRQSSSTPGRLSWLQRCVSGIFLSPERNAKNFVFKGSTRESEHRQPSMHSEDEEDRHQGVGHVTLASGSFSPEAERNVSRHQSKDRHNEKRLKRARSLSAVIKDALKPHTREEGDLDSQKSEKEVEQEETEEANASLQGRKRQRGHDSMLVVSGSESEYVAESTILAPGKRKRKQRDVGNYVLEESGKGKNDVKHYNLRHPTISIMGASEGPGADGKERGYFTQVMDVSPDHGRIVERNSGAPTTMDPSRNRFDHVMQEEQEMEVFVSLGDEESVEDAHGGDEYGEGTGKVGYLDEADEGDEEAKDGEESDKFSIWIPWKGVRLKSVR